MDCTLIEVEIAYFVLGISSALLEDFWKVNVTRFLEVVYN